MVSLYYRGLEGPNLVREHGHPRAMALAWRSWCASLIPEGQFLGSPSRGLRLQSTRIRISLGPMRAHLWAHSGVTNPQGSLHSVWRFCSSGLHGVWKLLGVALVRLSVPQVAPQGLRLKAIYWTWAM